MEGKPLCRLVRIESFLECVCYLSAQVRVFLGAAQTERPPHRPELWSQPALWLSVPSLNPENTHRMYTQLIVRINNRLLVGSDILK